MRLTLGRERQAGSGAWNTLSGRSFVRPHRSSECGALFQHRFFQAYQLFTAAPEPTPSLRLLMHLNAVKFRLRIDRV
jgi:hypothetical protein